MTDTFWMSEEGVSALTAQVDRAREDAQQASRHVERHCTLTLGDVGILPDTFMMSGAHRMAVSSVRGTLDHLVGRTRFVVSGIRDSVHDHETVEDESSRTFTDIGSLLGRGDARAHFHRYASMFEHLGGAPFTDHEEPTEVLRDPGIEQQQPLWEFDLYSPDTFSPPSWVREVIRNIVGRDPFEDAVRWLSGDWTAYERVLFTWVQIKQFSERLGRNLARAAWDLPDAWSGREATAAQWFLHRLADATMDFGLYCGQLVGHYRRAVEAAKSFNRLAAGILADLVVNAGLAAAASAALTAARAAKAVPHLAARAAAMAAERAAQAALVLLAAKIAGLVKRLLDGYDVFQKVMEGLAAAVNSYEFTRMRSLVVEQGLRR